MATNSEYWKKREQENLRKNLKSEAEYAKEIQQTYNFAMDQIQKEIDSFYAKYAKDEGITIAQAKKRASKLDMEEYSRKAKKYVKEKNFSKQANEEMKLYNLTMKINRLELLKASIGLELVSAFDELQQFYEQTLTERTMDEFNRQAGILGSSVPDNAAVMAATIVNASFHNAKYSERIWMHQDLLRNELGKLLTRGMVQGKNPRALARELRKTFQASIFNSLRLLWTELARVQTAAQMQSYKDNGFAEYEYLTARDFKVCATCKALDGKIFKVDEEETGTNSPPMHPCCRCSTTAHMDLNAYEKWLDGYSTTHNMSFKDWIKVKPTTKELRAIKRYISSDAYKINERLRNDVKLNVSDKHFVRNLDGILNRMPTYEGNLNRSVDITDPAKRKEFLQRHKTGGKITYKEFLSTTKGIMTYNPEADIQIYIENGRKGRDISSFNSSEKEVLYERNSSFRVMNVVDIDGTTYILLKEV